MVVFSPQTSAMATGDALPRKAMRLPRPLLRLTAGLLRLAPILALLAPWPLRAEPSVAVLDLPFEVKEFRAPGSRVASVVATSEALREDKSLRDEPLAVVWGPRGGAALALAGDRVRVIPLGQGGADLARTETARGAIPQSRQQARGPLTVHLSDPTRDYVHGVFGEPVEARTVSIVERRPIEIGPDPKPVPIEISRVEAGADAVFEDREPRLVTLDRGGDPKILVVRSRRDVGAALAVIGRDGKTWRVLAETPPAGAPQRWLNPAAVADLDGDGKADIALVRTPHLDGLLQIWTWEGDRLAFRAEAPGYANHVFGSAATELAAVVQLEGASRPVLVIPTLDRRSLALVRFDGEIKELRRIPLPAPAATGVAVLGTGSKTHILVGLEDGRLADVRP